MTKQELINHFKNDTKVLVSPTMEKAFRDVDRAAFVPEGLLDEAYEDYPLPIGFGATISQPTTVAFMLEKLNVRKGQKVLDIGSGSGWTTALLSHLVGPKGRVIGLEIIPELVTLGRKNIEHFYSDILENTRIRMASMPEIKLAKRGMMGLPEEAPFDRILVSAAAKEVPSKLIEQLKPVGALVIPVGQELEMQKIVILQKTKGGTVIAEEYPGFVFVPLR
ncbi:MAG: protein-L-isoaspartate O-methyltransferase [Candidatus Taylorbacteria bacterium RIFCSPHIGHO2_02_49_25]|uniref:Protein-L-isoaspartate O-methyltransferase n=1 Tax=Candidatus Taylorbacteria bacterium RIFCSPHIGHO2_02_49_25 TaxID=1802305 RepID=A0A1G2MH33_9BACT|nr:MAG: hypothetical protein UY62_C0068G0003 [Parcubacteria group bacterium GW2011_GWF2_50_9]OHA20783.1 MAG: protein-L-isoaspartate O-methyltransferase [Candidatus Taylorbacteria bacterium RIFCSPHIGHO2_01_FULL_49_60]OHA23178.1 MAG: protein-L-isoaspartate O-methyltransferase [Candidatus Taylorbacteria bacterium RIFCSPHIGHO2_02_49_25]OHA35735.1 MAG: protein-L-isoaspartate O-methyltransferase [Candidatus Taylorbacteria bacterium RIFCSPLOWO2_01_FULL_50_130]OHA36884.1 MAG: protein-L-isoaspartate O-m